MAENIDSVFIQDIHGVSEGHKFVTDFVAGIFGGCAGVLAGHPLDTVKVRLQSQQSILPSSFHPPVPLSAISTKVPYRGTWDCFMSIFRNEGISGLYKGLSSPLFGVAVINSLLFGVYGWCIHHIEEVPTHPTVWEIFLAGSASGLVNGFFSAPIELVKIRLQNQRESKAGAAVLYTGPIDCMRKIYRSGGWRGCFKGLGVTLFRETPSYGIYFASYELFSQWIIPPSKPNQSGSGIYSTMGILLAGGMAGVFGWLSTYPLDVIKTRMQSLENATNPNYRNMRIAYSTMRSSPSGWRIFLAGWNATAIRAFPTNGATFVVVAAVKSILGDS